MRFDKLIRDRSMLFELYQSLSRNYSICTKLSPIYYVNVCYCKHVLITFVSVQCKNQISKFQRKE